MTDRDEARAIAARARDLAHARMTAFCAWLAAAAIAASTGRILLELWAV